MLQIESPEKNIFVRTIENNNTIKWSGAFVAGFSLLDLLTIGNNISSFTEQAGIVAVGLIGVAAAALGEAGRKIDSIR